jgi:hypothetical protein
MCFSFLLVFFPNTIPCFLLLHLRCIVLPLSNLTFLRSTTIFGPGNAPRALQTRSSNSDYTKKSAGTRNTSYRIDHRPNYNEQCATSHKPTSNAVRTNGKSEYHVKPKHNPNRSSITPHKQPLAPPAPSPILPPSRAKHTNLYPMSWKRWLESSVSYF